MLKQADAIMEQDADSALTILTSINKNTLNKLDLPYFALLKTQAQVKTNVLLDSDSLIFIAYSNYSDDWWGDKGIRSNYYMGEVFYNKEKSREAMRYYLNALEESKRLNNNYWRAKAAERISDLFFNYYNYEEAAKYRKEAIKYYGKSNRVSNQRYAIADLGIDYMNDSKFEEATNLLDSIYNVATRENSEDTLLLKYISCPLTDAIERSKNKISLNLVTEPLETEEEKVQELYQRYKHARIYEVNEGLLDLVDSLLVYQNAIAEKIIKESITSTERDFYFVKSVKTKKRSDFFFLFFLIAVFSAISIWWIYRLRNKANRVELEANIESFIELKTHSENLDMKISKLEETVRNKGNYIDELKNTESQLRSDIYEKEKCINRLESDIEIQLNNIIGKDAVLQTLFKEKWTTLNMLCNEYYEKGDSSNTRRYILDSIEKELKKISSKKGLNQIEAAVDAHFDGIIGLLRKECPHLSEKDITLAILIIAGFSGKSISYLMGIKTGNYYVSKRRLVDKIIASETPYQKKFIDEICQ